MYALLSIDSVLRIALAMTLLFVVVPRLAWPRTPAANHLERFWWDFGAGLTLLTIAGQLLTLMKLYALPTLLLLCAAIILFGRAAYFHRRPLELLHAAQKWTVMATINVLERRVNVRRRLRRAWRRLRACIRPTPLALAWIALTLVAAAFRLYRPFASANLGYSDSYVHLYLLELLEQGRQVDPAWGPYPRGMHFLLLAIQRLTNIDEVLLVNFFGAFVGILTTLAVAYTARRLARSNVAGLLAGFVFATMEGGARQYFIIGGSFETLDRSWARLMTHTPYAQVPPGAGEFDVLLTAFQRQSSTLSQELAIALLFPAAMFLLEAFQGAGRRGQGADGVLAAAPASASQSPAPRALRPAPWPLAGFTLSTAAIAATHSGVLVPLVLLCGIIAIFFPRQIVRGALAGLAGIVLGSTWILGFIAYPYVGTNTRPGGTALFYFPFLRHFADAAGGTSQQEIEAYNSLTPFLAILTVVAILLIVRRRRGEVIAGVSFLVFLLIHLSWRLGLPQIIESRRNAEWLLMSMAILLGIAVSAFRWRLAAAAVVAAAWLFTIPNPKTLDLLNYSGYGTASLAVVEIAHQYEPFTWTLVSYGQEYPMVLGRGFHLPAADFLERYDPAAPELRIPTRHVFVMVERRPHRFEIHDWRARFGRANVEERLFTWCQLYRATHGDVRVFLDDGNVAVYQIDHTPPIAKEARAR